jgi:uncharacterized protein (TIGR02996 family)
MPPRLADGVRDAPVSDRAAFLRAIRHRPDDDTARLVYADWLDENGAPELAELIRVQIELHQIWNSDEPKTDDTDDPKRDARFTELRRREGEILAGPVGDHFAGFLDGACTELFARFDQRNIQRGFPDVIDPCDGEWWPGHGDALLAHLPITSVAFWTLPRCVETEYGILIQGDPRAEPIIRTSAGNGERFELAACRARWPEVRFEQLYRVFTGQAHAVIGAVTANATARMSRVSDVSRVRGR